MNFTSAQINSSLAPDTACCDVSSLRNSTVNGHHTLGSCRINCPSATHVDGAGTSNSYLSSHVDFQKTCLY